MASVEQLTALIDFLEIHKELALGRFNRTKEGRSLTKRLWAECADTLNSVSSDCVPKTPDQWRVYYNEYKSKLLKKIKLEKAEIGATGGGPSKQTPLTPLQEPLYDILGRDVGEPLPGIRHNPLSQHDHILEGLEVVEDAVPSARPWSVEFLEPAEQEMIVVVEVPADYSPSRDQQSREPLASTSSELATGTTAVTSSECTTGPTPSTSRELATGTTAATSKECTTDPTPGTSRELYPVATDPIRQARPVAPRKRRRRRSPVSQTKQATENEPAMREATERLENMERLNAEATHELAQATHRQAAALEAIAEGLRDYLRDMNEWRRSPRRLNRIRIYSSDSD